MSRATGWRVELRSSAAKSMRRLARPDRERITAALQRLPEGDVRRLAGGTGQWRLRVGEWRVRYRLDYADRVVDVLYIGPRGDAYHP